MSFFFAFSIAKDAIYAEDMQSNSFSSSSQVGIGLDPLEGLGGLITSPSISCLSSHSEVSVLERRLFASLFLPFPGGLHNVLLASFLVQPSPTKPEHTEESVSVLLRSPWKPRISTRYVRMHCQTSRFGYSLARPCGRPMTMQRGPALSPLHRAW